MHVLSTALGIQTAVRWAQVYYAPLMVYGASRKYWDALHAASLEGKSMYHEAMIPTTAIIYGLKGAAVMLPKRGDTYHCCTHDAAWLYGFYHNASAWCVLPGLPPPEHWSACWAVLQPGCAGSTTEPAPGALQLDR